MGDDPFETLVAAHHGEIHRYLARVTARVSDADDLSQETFLRAFRAHRQLPAGANFRAWLFAIATNLYRNHVRGEVRRRRALAAASTDPPVSAVTWPDGPVLLGETSQKIDRVVAGLPVKQRLAFTMRKIHELEYDAIGESLHCSAESARAHVFQALRKIRRGLDELAGVPAEPQP
ncbi:MAG TPA: RNA polymerase sigma factor [Candidatus Methylomirabilis sp.]|nr:RNA polymerase sigma factor [Candidatus Methylomirabilis sp.]